MDNKGYPNDCFRRCSNQNGKKQKICEWQFQRNKGRCHLDEEQKKIPLIDQEDFLKNMTNVIS